jgi:hypothetical protein
MYVLRLLSYHPHLRVTPRNCQRLLLCSVMVAQKIHDDTPLRNVDFAVAWGRVRSRRPAVLPVPSRHRRDIRTESSDRDAARRYYLVNDRSPSSESTPWSASSSVL